MRNYMVVALCLVTLFVVALDVFLLHPRTASAQGPVVVKLQKIETGHALRVAGDVVGVSCTSQECFVLAKDLPLPQ